MRRQDTGEHLQEPVGDRRLARSADADQRTDPGAARAPPGADVIQLRPVLPIAGAEQRMHELC